jgi:PKD repeat protein
LDALQLVTWNDYEEGTEIETGIDNCLCVEPTISGQTLTWAIPPDPRAVQKLGASQVDESTVDHYTIFISKDGQNLMTLANVPAGTHALDLSHFGLAAGNYILYVQAVGKASIQNKMSPPVGFNPVDQPPVVNLSVTPASGAAPLAVTASTTGSTDPDGSIASAKIDFGDGTVVSGPTATHTYAAPGPYTVLASATDNAGLTANATSVVSVAALAQDGVLISSPGSGASVTSDVQVVADAVSQQPISSFTVLVDGQTIYQIASAHIDTTLKVSPGAHVLQMQATDSSQATVSSSVSITVQGTIPPPVAALALSTPAGAPPDTVLACTAGSTGFISSSSVDFGDGTVQKGVAEVHTYADSQPHDVTATITDVDGLTSTATATALGTGPDFGFGISPANVSVHAGQQAAINLSVSANNGAFNSAISFACSSGLPTGATCTFSPSSVTPSSGTATSKLTISTKASSALLQPPGSRTISPLYSLWIGLPGLLLAGVRRRRVQSNVNKVWFIACALTLIAVQLGCGGGGSSSAGTQTSSQQIGNYTVSVSATSGSLQHSIQVTLTVN